MKYRIEIRNNQEEDIVIFAKTQSETLGKIEEILAARPDELFGYANGEIAKLDGKEVYCFFVESGKVYALTDTGSWQVRNRLYQLEEQYANAFVRINQSCLVRVSKIQKFQSSIGGSLSVVLKNGYQDYISRRQLRAVKERMGF